MKKGETNMENDTEKCFKCVYFQRFYTRGTKKFNSLNLGWCCEKQDVVKNTDICGCNNYKLKKRRSFRSDEMLLYTLNNLMTDISAVRQMLEEECGEKQ